MVTIQLSLDSETSAKLAYLAELWGQRKNDTAIDLLKNSVYEKFNEYSKNNIDINAIPRVVSHTSIGRRGTRDKVLYKGSDHRLTNGKVYQSYAEVLRLIRPELAKLYPEGKLYNVKTHGGDKAENIIKRYEPNIYKDLIRQK